MSTPTETPSGPKFDLNDLEARYRMFEKFALSDQRAYYKRTIDRHRTASSQVNQIRALIALLTAIASALVGLLVLLYFEGNGQCAGLVEDRSAFCRGLNTFIQMLVVLAIALPAFAGFFNSLSDLYQWDRLIAIYDTAVENIEVADARSPDKEMDELEYRASLNAFVQGTLQVMSDETAQWGQSIRTPVGIEEFIKRQRELAEKYGGDADKIGMGEKAAQNTGLASFTNMPPLQPGDSGSMPAVDQPASDGDGTDEPPDTPVG